MIKALDGMTNETGINMEDKAHYSPLSMTLKSADFYS